MGMPRRCSAEQMDISLAGSSCRLLCFTWTSTSHASCTGLLHKFPTRPEFSTLQTIMSRTKVVFQFTFDKCFLPALFSPSKHIFNIQLTNFTSEASQSDIMLLGTMEYTLTTEHKICSTYVIFIISIVQPMLLLLRTFTFVLHSSLSNSIIEAM